MNLNPVVIEIEPPVVKSKSDSITTESTLSPLSDRKTKDLNESTRPITEDKEQDYNSVSIEGSDKQIGKKPEGFLKKFTKKMLFIMANI